MTTWTDTIIDLSHWQAPVDFGAVRTGGIVAVILKATQGSGWIDNTFVARSMAALNAGLLVGAYHFADATNPSGQANLFLSVAGMLPVLAIDIEPNGLGDTVSVPQAAEIAARVAMAKGRPPPPPPPPPPPQKIAARVAMAKGQTPLVYIGLADCRFCSRIFR